MRTVFELSLLKTKKLANIQNVFLKFKTVFFFVQKERKGKKEREDQRTVGHTQRDKHKTALSIIGTSV